MRGASAFRDARHLAAAALMPYESRAMRSPRDVRDRGRRAPYAEPWLRRQREPSAPSMRRSPCKRASELYL